MHQRGLVIANIVAGLTALTHCLGYNLVMLSVLFQRGVILLHTAASWHNQVESCQNWVTWVYSRITAGVYSVVRMQASISQVGHVPIVCVGHGEHGRDVLQWNGGVCLNCSLLQSSNTWKRKVWLKTSHSFLLMFSSRDLQGILMTNLVVLLFVKKALIL